MAKSVESFSDFSAEESAKNKIDNKMVDVEAISLHESESRSLPKSTAPSVVSAKLGSLKSKGWKTFEEIDSTPVHSKCGDKRSKPTHHEDEPRYSKNSKSIKISRQQVTIRNPFERGDALYQHPFDKNRPNYQIQVKNTAKRPVKQFYVAVLSLAPNFTEEMWESNDLFKSEFQKFLFGTGVFYSVRSRRKDSGGKLLFSELTKLNTLRDRDVRFVVSVNPPRDNSLDLFKLEREFNENKKLFSLGIQTVWLDFKSFTGPKESYWYRLRDVYLNWCKQRQAGYNLSLEL